MNVHINPEVWNSFSAVQKRAVAENVLVEPLPRYDVGEIAAWVSTVTATIAVLAFALILL